MPKCLHGPHEFDTMFLFLVVEGIGDCSDPNKNDIFSFNFHSQPLEELEEVFVIVIIMAVK